MTVPRICFYSSAWRGGSGWFVHELALSIARAGARVALISPEAEPRWRDPVHPNLERLLLPQGAGGKGSTPYRASRALRRIVASFPLILRGRLHSGTFMVTMFDWLAMGVTHFIFIRLLGARLVYVVHDVKPHAWSFPSWLRFLEMRLLALSYRLPTRIVTLTTAARRQLLDDYGIAPERVNVIPHGAYVSGEPRPLSGERKVLLFGMLRRNKRILETIRAMALLPESSKIRLTIAGEPHAEDRSYWRECAVELERIGARARAEIGFVPEDRVRELVNECDGLVLPYEDFNSQSGVAILSIFAERMLICTDAGGIGELMASGLESIKIERPVTPASIAAALCAFQATPVEKLRGAAARSRARIADHLSWCRIGEEYVRLIASPAAVGRSS